MHFFDSTDYLWQFGIVILHPERPSNGMEGVASAEKGILLTVKKIDTTMALFDFMFGSEEHSDFNAEDYRSVAEDRRFRSQGSGNWTDADDWQCGEQDDHDGMYGFDSYEENDF